MRRFHGVGAGKLEASLPIPDGAVTGHPREGSLRRGWRPWFTEWALVYGRYKILWRNVSIYKVSVEAALVPG